MKKWLQNLSGVVIASVLAVALNGKAFAEEPKPEPPSVEIGTSVASTEAPASGAAAVGDASAAGFAAPEIQAASSPGSEVSMSPRPAAMPLLRATMPPRPAVMPSRPAVMLPCPALILPRRTH